MSLAGQDITILGAGIGGLTAARALALRGARVRIVEQAAVLREVGAGVQISPNGAVVLRALGLGAALDAVSTRAVAVELRDGASGRLVTRLDVARLRPEQGYHFMHRADLITLLGDAARDSGVEILLQNRVGRVDLSGACPALIMADGQVRSVPTLIGADGLHSPVRAALTGVVAPFFTHQTAWRAVIAGDPADAAVAEVHMAPGRHLVSYPLRGGTLRNIVAVEQRRGWTDESWSLRGDPAELRHGFRGFAPKVRGWLDRVDEVGLWGLFRHPVAKQWHRILPQGSVAILGDAAHPTLPFLAQGASMALEDAWVLAHNLDTMDLPTALGEYQSSRILRTSRVVEAANRNARTYHLGGTKRIIGHAVMRLGGAIAPSLALRRFDWLYGLDVTRQD